MATNIKNKRKRITFSFFEDDKFIEIINQINKDYDALTPLEVIKFIASKFYKENYTSSNNNDGPSRQPTKAEIDIITDFERRLEENKVSLLSLEQIIQSEIELEKEKKIIK